MDERAVFERVQPMCGPHAEVQVRSPDRNHWSVPDRPADERTLDRVFDRACELVQVGVEAGRSLVSRTLHFGQFVLL